MSEERIKRKDLWKQLSNLKNINEWFKAAENLGLQITQSKGGTSHYAIRLPGYESTDIRGLVSTVYAHGTMRKDVNEKIFKKMLDKNITENDIWKALGMLKD